MTKQYKEITYTVCDLHLSYVIVDAMTGIQIDETEYVDLELAARAAINYARVCNRVVTVELYDYNKHNVFATACS